MVYNVLDPFIINKVVSQLELPEIWTPEKVLYKVPDPLTANAIISQYKFLKTARKSP